MRNVLKPSFGVSAGACLLLTLGWARSTAAQFPQWSTFPLQYVDARVLPRGQLQVGFLPSYAHYDSRWDSSGTMQPLGLYLSPDTAGSNFLPSLSSAEAAMRRLTGDSTYGMNLGQVKLPLDADVRRFPFDFAVGLTDWLTLGVRVPLVKTRVQGVLTLDSTDANVGWNQAAAAAGNAAAATEILALLSQLQDAITTLQANIDRGDYGCPSSIQCDSARALLARAQALLTDLTTLSGPPGSGTPIPPVAPLVSSQAGSRILSELAAVASQLAVLGAGAVPTSFPLPTAKLDSAAVQRIVTQSEFGYDLLPLTTPRRTYTIGDVEASLRLALLRGNRFRAVLTTGVRLPTGKRDNPNQVLDLGTGDHQLDLEGGLEVAWEPGPLGLSGVAMYTHQFADQLPMRWAPPERPLEPAAYTYLTNRQLGDVFRAAVYPSLRLSEGFRVYGSAYYFHKAADSYTLPSAVAPVPGSPSPAEMALVGGQSLSIGGGIAYRATRPQRDTTGTRTALPVEAGLSYQAAYHGSGGLVPKSTMLNLYLRFYYRLWGTVTQPARPSS